MKKYSVLVSNRNNRKTIEKLTPCGMEYVSICTHVRSILKIHFGKVVLLPLIYRNFGKLSNKFQN